MSNISTTFLWKLPILRDASNIAINDPHQAILAIIITLLLLLKYLLPPKSSSPPLPPGPYGLPILGSLPFLESQVHRHYTKLSETYGPIFKLKLGNKLCVVISSLSLVKQVTRDQDTTFAHKELTVAGSIFSEGGNDVAFSAYNSNWRRLKKIMVGQMLSNANLDACYALRREEVRNVIRVIYGQKGNLVNLSDLAFMAVVNANMSTMWGDTLKGEEGYRLGLEFKEVMEELLCYLGKPNVSEYFPWLAKFDLQGIEKDTKKVCHWLDKFVNNIIDQRKVQGKKNINGKESSKDLLQFLIDLKECGGEESISWTHVKTLLVETIVGGTDTIATSIEWIMTELLNHPEMMKKLQEELIQVVGPNNNVEESHIFQLSYLEAVIMESLRLHPPVPFPFPRQPSSNATVAGYLIPKGSRVILNIWAMHRDPKYWEDPLEFRPERFLNRNSTGGGIDFSGNSFQFLPFGSGRRLCPGIFLAERMIRFTIASFVHSFDWKLPESTAKLDTEEVYAAVIKKREPVIAIPSLRLSNLQLYEL